MQSYAFFAKRKSFCPVFLASWFYKNLFGCSFGKELERIGNNLFQQLEIILFIIIIRATWAATSAGALLGCFVGHVLPDSFYQLACRLYVTFHVLLLYVDIAIVITVFT